MRTPLPPRGWVPVLLFGAACAASSEADENPFLAEYEMSLASADYCELPPTVSEVLVVRPDSTEEPIDDVNWFARPMAHDGTDRIVAFASHNQNYLYNLTTGVRVKIPDRSDAVATPDGKYMTVPGNYTPDSTIRFYPAAPLLEHLARGEDADHIEPAFVHDREDMGRTYYQSTAIVSVDTTPDLITTTYRLMFSGTGNQSQFRIADYAFHHRAPTGELSGVTASAPMHLCPEITNDLNTPFISKDARYVASYTSHSSDRQYSAGASLKIFEIVDTNPEAGTTSCREVADLGFAAGKADFSFDGTQLTFHTSQGGFLTPFINGGLRTGTITDVVVAELQTDSDGNITGVGGMQRLTTSLQSGVGSYFPAYFPDGSLFYIANAVPADSDQDKRFHFRAVKPFPNTWRDVTIAADQQDQWHELAGLWESACSARQPSLTAAPFPAQLHEAPWLSLALNARQCHALLEDSQGDDGAGDRDWGGLAQLCTSLP